MLQLIVILHLSHVRVIELHRIGLIRLLPTVLNNPLRSCFDKIF
jgi:hypothetical protein